MKWSYLIQTRVLHSARALRQGFIHRGGQCGVSSIWDFSIPAIYTPRYQWKYSRAKVYVQTTKDRSERHKHQLYICLFFVIALSFKQISTWVGCTEGLSLTFFSSPSPIKNPSSTKYVHSSVLWKLLSIWRITVGHYLHVGCTEYHISDIFSILGH